MDFLLKKLSKCLIVHSGALKTTTEGTCFGFQSFRKQFPKQQNMLHDVANICLDDTEETSAIINNYLIILKFSHKLFRVGRWSSPFSQIDFTSNIAHLSSSRKLTEYANWPTNHPAALAVAMTSTFLRSSCNFQGWRRWTATKRSWDFKR